MFGEILAGLGMGAVNSIGNMWSSDRAFDKSMQAWKAQNEYNKPINQMARLKEAGLNPNMVYGSGNAAGITTSGAPGYTPPKVNIDPLAKYYEIKNQSLQSLALKAQIEQTKAQTLEAVARANNVNEQTKATAYDNSLFVGSGVSRYDTGIVKSLGRIASQLLGGDVGKYMAGTRDDVNYVLQYPARRAEIAEYRMKRR